MQTLLKTLLAHIADTHIHGDPETVVTGITHDSRHIEPGDLFVCLKGAAFDGHTFAAEALKQGASALVINEKGIEAAGVVLPEGATVVSVPDTRKALPHLACAFYADPSYKMTVVGVTGTNGKTTTTRMMAAILRAAGYSVGTIGTLGAELDGKPIPSDHTTPEADHLQKLLAEMRDSGASAVVMEVSSHALAQYRTDGIAFAAGIFTNLTQDHLDYHGDMDAYFKAKARLFAEYPVLYPRPEGGLFTSVINVAQWEGRDLVTLARGDVLTYTTKDNPAVLKARDIELSPTEVRFTAVYDSGIEAWELPIVLPIGGAFQVGNALGAIGAALRLGVKKEVIAEGLAALGSVPGRFESVAVPNNQYSVVVDYAHTPDGLENVLRSARELKPKRVITVFGCGGNRDKTKRPKMGKLAAELSEIAIVTSDNPRKEEPDAIIVDILAGMQGDTVNAEILVEADRRTAIFLAIEQAESGDLVVIAGKGHEDYQIVGDQVLAFDDRLVAAEAIGAKR